MIEFLRRLTHAARLLARDGRVPRPLRWLARLALLPIPGPIDEAALLLHALILGVFYRAPLRDAWQEAVMANSRLPSGDPST